ncbi:MAG: SDR family NAD(P)-dependent oxidoreductase [Alphaproteobacteria bacterium]
MTLSGKCALVTGSTAGLGLAIADGLAAAGADVVLHGPAPDAAADAAAADLARRHGVRAVHQPADLRDPDAIAAMMAAIAAAGRSPDIVVNNAVVRHFAPVERFPVARWDEALAVNLSAAFHTIRLALPQMRARDWGRIVNMASGYSFFASADRVDYITTKTALLGLTRAVALETAQTGITCNALCPGTVPTPAITARIDALAASRGIALAEAERVYLADRQPSGRFVAMDGVAAMIVFLCGPGARDITGAALPIDGGWTAS